MSDLRAWSGVLVGSLAGEGKGGRLDRDPDRGPGAGGLLGS